MKEDGNNEHQAETSLCWRCRYGMCIQEAELEPIVAPMSQEDPFGNEDSEPHLMGHLIEHERTKTVCFWRPPAVENALPILVAFVKKCNRFENKS